MRYKEWRYCTKNENGLFEVSWEIKHNFLGWLFKKRTVFVFEHKVVWINKKTGLPASDCDLNSISDVLILSEISPIYKVAFDQLRKLKADRGWK